ncbi:Lon protease-like protein 2, peroxisomal [Hypoxylon sp. NC1633]|nr:Lon protease-like protein 2, peroxisomal [Hypoxylon sp. NC1633]
MPSSEVMPVITLRKEQVLFPSALVEIPIFNGPTELVPLLSNLITRAEESSTSVTQVPIVCVPLTSPLLNGDSQRPGNTPGQYERSLNDRDDQLFSYGVSGKITSILGRNGTMVLVVQGIDRVSVQQVTQNRPFVEARVLPHEDLIEEQQLQSSSFVKLFETLHRLAKEYISILRQSAQLYGNVSPALSYIMTPEINEIIAEIGPNDGGLMADISMNLVPQASYKQKLSVLAAVDVAERMGKVLPLLKGSFYNLQHSMRYNKILFPTVVVKTGTSRSPSALKTRSSGLARGSPFNPFGGEPSSEQDSDDLQDLEKKIEAAKLPPEAANVAEREFKRLKQMRPSQAEYQVVRTYLETLADIPWSVSTDDPIGAGTLETARKQLDDDHYGIEKVKKRLLSYLTIVRLMQSANDAIDQKIKQAEQDMANLKLTNDAAEEGAPPHHELEEKVKASSLKVQMLTSQRQSEKAPILLLVGPPGVGKTSIAKSIATALGRKFHRISLGGVKDEAEIRGHRRTYVAAMPGLIVQGLKRAGVSNAVFLLDEIDKLGMSNHHGDPTAAMLEVLDPEQNHAFHDHYVNTPVDLSKIIFIATANTLDTIPGPLLDRMETLEFSGYTPLEKRHIALRHLVPKQIRMNGLSEDQVYFSEESISKIIESYTRESGVRSLEREIGSVCRAKAVEFVEASDRGQPESYQADVTVEDLESLLGIEKFDNEIAEQTAQPGIVTGLVAYSSGGNGGILFIEVLDMPGNGSVELTGNLGDVLKESVHVARSWVRSHAFELGLTPDPTEDIMKKRSLHVHCPSGAVPKDGPSSGMAQAIALISLLSGRPVPPTMAMTGEFQLSGHVKKVGGIAEKLIGAYRAGVKTVLLPAQNEKDAREVPAEVRDGLNIVYVSHIREAIGHIWPGVQWSGVQLSEESNPQPVQSRL